MATRSPGSGSGTAPGPTNGAARPEPDRRPSLTPISLFLVLLAFWVLTQIQFVLILGLLGLLLGTILEGPVRRFEARHIPRPAAIFLVYAAIIGTLVLLVLLIIPPVSDQAGDFRTEVPATLRELEAEWNASSNPLLSGAGADLLDRAVSFVEAPEGSASADAAEQAIPVLTSVTTGVVGVLTLLVITFYYLMEKALIRQLIIQQLSAERQPRINRIWDDVESKVGGWMRGQLLLCLIIGTIATISYGIIGLSFWPLLGLWAGMTEIIPIVGPWIGGIPAVLVAVTMSWEKALITAGIIVGMQTLENWVLVPRVMRGAVGLTPLTVFVAILAGTQFMGVVGAVLAIPIAATLQVVLTNFLDARRVRTESQNISGWRWMLTRAIGEDEDGPVSGTAEPASTPAAEHLRSKDDTPAAMPASDADPRLAVRAQRPASSPGAWAALRRPRTETPADGDDTGLDGAP